MLRYNKIKRKGEFLSQISGISLKVINAYIGFKKHSWGFSSAYLHAHVGVF